MAFWTVFLGMFAAANVYRVEFSKRIDAERDRELFASSVQAVDLFKAKVAVTATSVGDLAHFLEVSPGADGSLFEDLATRICVGPNGLEAVALVEEVHQSTRAEFEKTRLGGKPILAVAEKGTAPSPPKSRYLVIRDIVPLDANRAALGLDLLSEGRREDALRRAIQVSDIVFSAPVNPVQTTESGSLSSLVVHGVGNRTGTKQSQRFVSAVFSVAALAASTNELAQGARIVQIADITDLPQSLVMWRAEAPNASGREVKQTLQAGGRTYEVLCQPKRAGQDQGTIALAAIWILGTAVSLLAAILAKLMVEQRTLADAHRRELQQLAAEMMDEAERARLGRP